MVASLLQDVIAKVLGKYVEHIRDEDMEVNIMAGNLKLKNLVMKKSFFEELDLPVELRLGRINNIQGKISITKIGSEPIEVEVDGIYLFLGTHYIGHGFLIAQKKLGASYDNFFRELSPDEKRRQIAEYIQASLVRIAEKVKQDLEGSKDGSMGYMQRLMVKAIDNLQVLIKNVNVQIESTDIGGNSLAFGLGINSLELVTTDADWKKHFLDRTDPANKAEPLRKCIHLDGFYLYFLTSTDGYQPDLSVSPAPPKIITSNFILRPMNITVHFTHNGAEENGKPLVHMNIVLSSIKLQVSKPQYDMFVSLGEHTAGFFKELSEREAKRRYLMYRPLYRVKDKETDGRLKSFKNPNAVRWWRYLGKCVCRMIREWHTRVAQFKLPPFLEMYHKRKFMEIFVKEKMKSEASVTDLDKRMFEKILLLYDVKKLNSWAEDAVYQIERTSQDEVQKKKKTEGVLGGLFSWGAAKEEKKPAIQDSLKQIIELMRKSLDSEAAQQTVKKEGRTLFVGEFVIESAAVKLYQKAGAGIKETIEAQMGRLVLGCKKRADGLDVDATIKSVGLVGVSEQDGEVIKLISMPEQGEEYYFKLGVSMANNEDGAKKVKVDLATKSFVFYYQQVLLLELLTFLGKDMASKLTQKTRQSLSNLGKDSLTTLKASLGKYCFDIKVSVASPIVVLPLLKNNDPLSPVWVVRLGDLNIVSVECADQKYVTLNAALKKINLEYHQSCRGYFKGETAGVFYVLQDFSAAFCVSLKNSSGELSPGPQVIIKSKFDDLKLKFTPATYDNLLGIGKVLALKARIAQMLKSDKKSILDMSKKVGALYLLSGSWKKHYVVLSGAYLYFYEANKQTEPSAYCYLDNAVVKKQGLDKESKLFTIVINNGPQSLLLGAETEKQCEDWVTTLVEYVGSISVPRIQSIEKVAEPSDKTQILADCELQLPKIDIDLLDEQSGRWAIGNIGELSLKLVARPEDVSVSVICERLSILHPSQVLCPIVISTKEGQRALDCRINVVTVPSPPTHADKKISVDVKVCNVASMFSPPFVKKFVQYVSTVGKKSRDKQLQESEGTSHIPSSVVVLAHEEGPEIIKKSGTCREKPSVEIEVKVALQGASLVCLHHEYKTPFIKAELQASTISYEKRCDHEVLYGNLGDIEATDMTNYPHTILPKEFPMEPMKFEEIVEKYSFTRLATIKTTKDKPALELHMYDPGCPEMPTEVPNTKTTLVLRFAEVWAMYIDEITLKRMLDYIIDQLCYSFSPNEQQPVKRPEEGKIVEFALPIDFTKFQCEIGRVVAELKPRAHYEKRFCLMSENLEISNDRGMEAGRYVVKTEKAEKKAVCCNWIGILGTKMHLMYNETMISEPFDLSIQISAPAITSEEFNVHDNTRVNLALVTKVKFGGPLTLSLNTEQFNLLLQCMNLNLTYTDGLEEFFLFARVGQRKAKDSLKVEVAVDCPKAALELFDHENERLLLSQIHSIYVSSRLFWDGRVITEINSEQMNLYDRVLLNPKVPMMYPREKSPSQSHVDPKKPPISKNNISIVMKITPREKKGCIISEKDWKIEVSNQLLVFRMNTLFAALNLISVSMPNYELLPDKPNRYYSEPSTMSFKVDIINSTMLLPAEERTQALALEGIFTVEYSQCGLEDVMQDSLISLPFFTEKIERGFSIMLKNVSTFLCAWKENPTEQYVMSKCQRKLVIEPVSFIKFEQHESVEMGTDKTSCARNLLRKLDTSNMIFTLSYKDVGSIFRILEYHLEHMSKDHFVKVARYYQAKVPKLGVQVDKVPPYVYDRSSALKPSDIAEALSNAVSYYLSQTGKLEEMRQELLVLNSQKARQSALLRGIEDNASVKYKVTKILTSEVEFKMNISPEIGFLLVNQSHGVFCPLFYVRLIGPSYRYTVRDGKDMTSKYRGHIAVNYYNSGASAWEPLLEPIDLNLNGVPNFERRGNKETLTLQLQKELCVNITDTLVNLVKDCWRFWNLDTIEKKREKERVVIIRQNPGLADEAMLSGNYETTSEYAIENQSGETIVLTLKDLPRPQAIRIAPQEIINLSTDPSDSIKSYNMMNRRTFHVSVAFESAAKIQPISSLNLSQAFSFNHKISAADRSMSFQCCNKVVNMRKVFTIFTSYQFLNECDLPVSITFQLSPGKSQTLAILEKASVQSIPLFLINTPVSITVQGAEDASKSNFTFADLRRKMSTKRPVQITIGDGCYGILTIHPNADDSCCMFKLWPPYCVYNCLPVDLGLKFTAEGTEYSLKPQGSSYIYTQAINKKCPLEVSIPKFEKNQFDFEYKQDCVLYPLKMRDMTRKEVTIRMRVVLNKLAQYLLVFYVDHAIKNHTADNLMLFGVKENMARELAGQNIGEEKVTLLNKEKSLLVCLDRKHNSQHLDMGKNCVVKEFSISYAKKYMTRSEYVMRILSDEMLADTGIRTKFYHIYPKFTFINETKNDMQVRQVDCADIQQLCPAGGKLAFVWPNAAKPCKVNLTFPGTRDTEPFDVNRIGSIVQQLVSGDGRSLGEIVNIERYTDNDAWYIKVSKESNETPYYSIQNESQYVTVGYKEKGARFDYQYLDTESRIAFGWLHPQNLHVVQLQFLWGKLNQRPVMLTEKAFDFSMEKVKRYDPIDLTIRAQQGKYVWVELESDGDSKILRIRDSLKGQGQAEQRCEQSCSVLINNVGISLVSSYLGKKLELLYLDFKRIDLSYADTDQLQRNIKLTIQDMQMDNQMKEETVYPVTFCRAPREGKTQPPFLTIQCKSKLLSEPRAKFYSFELFQVDIIPFMLKLEEDHILALTDFLNNCKMPAGTVSIKAKLVQTKGQKAVTVNIDTLKISELKLDMWFKHSLESKKAGNIVVRGLTSAFFNVKELPITFEAHMYTNVYAKLSTVAKVILENYRRTLESKTLGLIAGVIFAPLRDVGVGLTSFFEGTMNGAPGLVSGTTSLIKGTINGAFGTAQGVTSTISQGILALSTDEEYIREKQKQDEQTKPNNVIEGVGLGIFSAIQSVGSGLVGIVSKPIEGASKGGAAGFFKGMGKGLAGAVTKPFSGGFDLISKTAEGIKNTTNIMNEETKQPIRVRDIRPFFTSHKLIKTYSLVQMKTLAELSRINGTRYANDNLLYVWRHGGDRSSPMIILVTEERVVYIQKYTRVWEIRMSQLKLVEAREKFIVFHYADDTCVGEKAIELNSVETANSLQKELSEVVSQQLTD